MFKHFATVSLAIFVSQATFAHDINDGSRHVHTAAGYTLDHVVAEEVVASVPKLYGTGRTVAPIQTIEKEVLPLVQPAPAVKLTASDKAKIEAYFAQQPARPTAQKVFRTGPGIAGAHYYDFERERRYDVDGNAYYVESRHGAAPVPKHGSDHAAETGTQFINGVAVPSTGHVVIMNKYAVKDSPKTINRNELALIAVRMKADWDARGRALDSKLDALKPRLANDRIEFVTLDITNEARKERSRQMAKVMGFDWFERYENKPDALLLVRPATGEVVKTLDSRVHSDELEQLVLDAAGLRTGDYDHNNYTSGRERHHYQPSTNHY